MTNNHMIFAEAKYSVLRKQSVCLSHERHARDCCHPTHTTCRYS